MRVLITGGGGNLGRVLAPALVDAGHEPAPDRLPRSGSLAHCIKQPDGPLR